MSNYFAGDIEPGDRILSRQTFPMLTRGNDVDVVAGELQVDMTVASVRPSDFEPEHIVIGFRGSSWRIEVHRARVIRCA